MLDIITTIFKYWFWVDERNHIFVNKKLTKDDSFYVFVYLTFANIKSKKNLTLNKLARLPVKNLDMTINIEVFSESDVNSYFNKREEEDTITIEDIDVDKIPDFINQYGYGICDIICEIHHLYNFKGQVNLKPIMFHEQVVTSVAIIADNIAKANHNSIPKLNMYIPNENNR